MWPRTGDLRDCAIAFLGLSDWRFRKPIFLGDTIAKKVSMPLVHGIAAFIFAVLGLLTLFNVGDLF